jgi:hypothetical protein
LITEDFIQTVTQAIRDDMERIANTVVTGSCPSFEDYKSKSGYIKGQKRAIELLNDAFSKYIAS